MTNKPTPMYSAYFAVEKSLLADGIPVERSVLVQEFSKGEKHGLTDLSLWEYQEFLTWLRTKQTALLEEHQILDKRQKVRRKIIALFHKVEYKKPDGSIDMERVDAWCIKYGQFHKSLNQHQYTELVKLCTQVEKLYESFIKTV